MKTLFFVRHAKASQHMLNLDDIDRPLIERGYYDAHAMSKKLSANKIKPELIVTSHGIRALSTALIFARNLDINAGKIQLIEKLYNASLANVLETIYEFPKNLNEVMLFGHNPSITNVTNLFINDLLEHMPTCAVSCIDFAINEWTEVKPRSGKLRFFDHPKNN